MKKFLTLLLGQFISSIGSGLTDFGLAIYVLHLTGSVMAISIVSICAFLPTIVLTPIGGILADRYDRRAMMIIGELFQGLSLLLCLFTISSANPSFVLICVGVGVSSAFAALIEPAFRATITDMVTKDEFAKAGGLVQIANNAKLLISPVIAGYLLTITKINTLLIIDILTFFTTTLTILLVKKQMKQEQKKEKRGMFLEWKEGIQAINSTKGIWSVTIIMTLAVFCLGFIQILSKPLILAFASETQLGTLTTIVAMGMLVGSILISMLKGKNNYHVLLSVGLTLCGLFMALMGVKANIILVSVFGFMMFVCMPVVQISAEVLVRNNLKNEVQGRAFGMIGFISQMGYIVAYLCAGGLSDYLFEPFMNGNTKLAQMIGKGIGTGTGRGVALLVILSGIMLVMTGVMTGKAKGISLLSKDVGNNE